MTINLPYDLLKEAQALCPDQNKTEIIRQSLENLVHARRDITFVRKYAGKMNLISYE